MSARARQRDRQIVDRYTDQPDRPPGGLRAEIERAFDRRPLQLYALVDLDPALRLTESWLALGPDRVAIARPRTGGWTIEVVERTRIRQVRQTPGMSCHVPSLGAEPDQPPPAGLALNQRTRREAGVRPR